VDDWDDLPIRLYTGAGHMVAMAWSDFDTLWLSAHKELPFDIGDEVIRWGPHHQHHTHLNRALGQRMVGVWLGQYEVRPPNLAAGLWTRVRIDLEQGALEIFNALDENGYAYRDVIPSGVWVDVFAEEGPG